MSMRAHEVRAILERQKLEQSNQTPLFPCQSANLGSYLIAANQLRYKGAQLAPNGQTWSSSSTTRTPEGRTCCTASTPEPWNL